MKKRWGKPITQVQRFVPQEYCGPCDTNNDGKIYRFVKITNKTLRIDLKPFDTFQNGDVLNTQSNTYINYKYSQDELDGMLPTATIYEKTSSGSEVPNVTRDDGTDRTHISYKLYTETIYIPHTGYAYKAEKIVS